jgi:hypothetical protein
MLIDDVKNMLNEARNNMDVPCTTALTLALNECQRRFCGADPSDQELLQILEKLKEMTEANRKSQESKGRDASSVCKQIEILDSLIQRN